MPGMARAPLYVPCDDQRWVVHCPRNLQVHEATFRGCVWQTTVAAASFCTIAHAWRRVHTCTLDGCAWLASMVATSLLGSASAGPAAAAAGTLPGLAARPRCSSFLAALLGVLALPARCFAMVA